MEYFFTCQKSDRNTCNILACVPNTQTGSFTHHFVSRYILLNLLYGGNYTALQKYHTACNICKRFHVHKNSFF